jgi:hypothetical protein
MIPTTDHSLRIPIQKQKLPIKPITEFTAYNPKGQGLHPILHSFTTKNKINYPEIKQKQKTNNIYHFQLFPVFQNKQEKIEELQSCFSKSKKKKKKLNHAKLLQKGYTICGTKYSINQRKYDSDIEALFICMYKAENRSFRTYTSKKKLKLKFIQKKKKEASELTCERW